MGQYAGDRVRTKHVSGIRASLQPGEICKTTPSLLSSTESYAGRKQYPSHSRSVNSDPAGALQISSPENVFDYNYKSQLQSCLLDKRNP